MITAIEFEGQWCQYSADNPALPVLVKGGGIQWVAWGRSFQQGGPAPLGRWLRLEDLKDGLAKAHERRAVKVPASRFWMHREDNLRIVEVPFGSFLQAIVMRVDPDDALALVAYIVNVPAEPPNDALCDRWPRIV